MSASLILTIDTMVHAQKRPEPIVTKTVKHATTSDKELEAAIRKWNGTDDTNEVRYHHNKVDLNSDRQPDAIVAVLDQSSCGTGGCPMLIFKGDGRGGYQLVTEMSVSRPPLIVLKIKTRGWNDLVMYVSGGGIKPYYSLLKFDGKTYPENPTVEPEIPKRTRVKGIEYLSGIDSYDTGFLLK